MSNEIYKKKQLSMHTVKQTKAHQQSDINEQLLQWQQLRGYVALSIDLVRENDGMVGNRKVRGKGDSMQKSLQIAKSIDFGCEWQMSNLFLSWKKISQKI